jgi:(p)ppGpp synthase/HD superfamily hydrolase
MCRLKVTGRNTDSLLSDLLTTVSKNNAMISSFNSNLIYENHLQADLAVNIKGQPHLAELMSALRKVKNVMTVERVD